MGYDCYCDYEQPSFYVQEKRKARKPHVCEECGGPIKPSERYECVTGCWDGHVGRYKTCLRCCDLRQWVKNNVPCLCWAHGNLGQDLQDAIHEAIWRAPAETAGLFVGYARRVILQRRHNEAARAAA